MVNNKVSDQQSLVTEGSGVQQTTEFQTGEWSVKGCLEQGGQYTMIAQGGGRDPVDPKERMFVLLLL